MTEAKIRKILEDGGILRLGCIHYTALVSYCGCTKHDEEFSSIDELIEEIKEHCGGDFSFIENIEKVS